MTEAADVAIGPATREDLCEVAALAALALREGWSEESFAAALDAPGAVCRTARCEGNVLAGFLVAQRAGDDVEVLALAVAAAWRRRGVARALVSAAVAGAPARRVLLEVRSSNAGALAFYTTLGFEVVGSRRGYYTDGDDALLLTWHVLPDAAERGDAEGEAA